jgi:hypothetical protein
MALKQSSDTAWLGLDLGTQSVRAMVVSGTGETLVVGSHKLTSRRAALRDIAASHPQERVLVVAHNTLIRLTLCSLFSIPLARYRTVFPAVRNGALTEIRLEDDSAALLQYNCPLGTACGPPPSNQTS